MKLIDTVKCPKDIKSLGLPQLEQLCSEIRSFLVETVSETGGHIGTNLGCIELTTALHYLFDSPADSILFDTGHQGYTHKILTGRKADFPTLNRNGGMSRFVVPEESRHDVLGASHGGTALSTGVGMALANKLAGNDHCVVAVVGDGALVEGNTFEGLNFGAGEDLPLIILINDNGMAIAPNVGGIKNLFSGVDWQDKSRHYFTGLGYSYHAVPNGHDIADLINTLKQARSELPDGPVIVHVKTEKGKGLACAAQHKYKMHFSMPFDPETGSGASPTPAGETYAVVAAGTLLELMEKDERLVAITPATPYASELDRIFEKFPERTTDVGMAEQHAVSMAAGLALRGMKPVVCFQSTFMQRAMDQIFHDIAYMDLPVTFMTVRSGFAGYDSPTHHGIIDFSYLQAIPNLKIFYAGTRFDLDSVMRWRLANPQGPMVILYPYEQVRKDEIEPEPANRDTRLPECIGEPAEICLIATGNRLGTALKIRDTLNMEGRDSCLINIRWLKPLPEKELLPYIRGSKLVVSLEENIITNGLGSRLAAFICDHDLETRLLRAAIPDVFVAAGDKDELSRITGIDAESICAAIREKMS